MDDFNIHGKKQKMKKKKNYLELSIAEKQKVKEEIVNKWKIIIDLKKK